MAGTLKAARLGLHARLLLQIRSTGILVCRSIFFIALNRFGSSWVLRVRLIGLLFLAGSSVFVLRRRVLRLRC